MFVLETRLFRPQAAITIAISRFARSRRSNLRILVRSLAYPPRDEKLIIGAGVGTEDTFVV